MFTHFIVGCFFAVPYIYDVNKGVSLNETLEKGIQIFRGAYVLVQPVRFVKMRYRQPTASCSAELSPFLKQNRVTITRVPGGMLLKRVLMQALSLVTSICYRLLMKGSKISSAQLAAASLPPFSLCLRCSWSNIAPSPSIRQTTRELSFYLTWRR